jgi:hypothetical protein
MSLTDRQRVELGLPAHMMLAVLIAGANVREPPPPSADANTREAWGQFIETKKLLVAACGEPLTGLWPKKKELQIMKRTERLHAEIVEPYIDAGAQVKKVGLIAFHLLQAMVLSEYLVVGEDSSMGKALEVMLPALSPWEGSTPKEVADFEAVNASAQKQSKKILAALQKQGYYVGVAFEG